MNFVSFYNMRYVCCASTETWLFGVHIHILGTANYHQRKDALFHFVILNTVHTAVFYWHLLVRNII